MRSRQHRHERGCGQPLVRQPRDTAGQPQESHVDAPVLHVLRESCRPGGRRDQPEVHQRVPRVEVAHDARQVDGRRVREDADGDGAAECARAVGEGAHPVGRLERRARRGKQLGADRRQPHPVGVAVEQLDAQFPLEGSDARGDRRLRREHAVRGACEVALVGHGDEVLELTRVHAAIVVVDCQYRTYPLDSMAVRAHHDSHEHHRTARDA